MVLQLEAAQVDTFAAFDHPGSPRNYGVEYLCSDGGFDAYSSAYDACLAVSCRHHSNLQLLQLLPPPLTAD